MRWIIRSSLRFPFVVVGLAAVLVFFGAQQLGHEQVDVFPEFAPTQVQIQTACLGLSAGEVEDLVTVPLEDGLEGVSGVNVIRSESVAQLSSIILRFKPGTDIFTARQLVQERLQAVSPTLPTWAAPPFMMQPVSATSRIMSVGLSSKHLSLMDLSLTAYWKIRARLLRVPGVANVAIWGERLKQLQVQVEPHRLAAAHVSLDHVMEVTSNALDAGLLRFVPGHFVGTEGFIETPEQRFSVRNVLPIASPGDLARIPLAHRGSTTLRIGDVSKVVYGAQPPIGDAVVNSGPGLLLVIEKFPGANTIRVTQAIDDALAEMKPGLPGIRIDSHIFRPATFISTAIDNLTNAVVIGCILVMLVLIAFLFEWRAAVISLVAIPLSLISAAIVLDLRGATVNTMILAGFAVAAGVVVDDAIIDMENIVRRLRLHRATGEKVPLWRVVLNASLEVRSAVVYATFIDVVAVAPVLFLGGLSGAFFAPLALSYALAVLASLAVAMTVTPALALILLRRAPLKPRDPPLIRGLKRVYAPVLSRLVRAPRVLLLCVAGGAAAAVIIAPTLGSDLFPTFKESDFLVHWSTKGGTSDAEEVRTITRVSKEIRKIPGVRDFGSHIGQAFLGEEISGVNFGENWISVSPGADYDKTMAAIRRVAESAPGIFRDVQTYLRERIDEVLTGATEPVVVRIFGPDLHRLRRQAQRVVQALGSVKGLQDLHAEQSEDIPELVVREKLGVARRYGLKPGDIRRASGTLLASEEVGDIYRGGRAYDVAVWSTLATRASVRDVRALPIDTPRGGTVPLGKLASVRVAPTPNIIRRENGSRRIDVTAALAGRDLSSATSEVQARLATVHLPLGYHAELVGEAAERAAAGNRLLVYAAFAGLTILLLLQAAFGSFRLAGLLFITLPSALVGGVLAVYAGLGTISLGALIGFYTVMGIGARNGIMMISHFQHLEREEGESFGPRLVIRGAGERLAPILMTALATGLALVPLALSGSKPGQEIEHPMAIVILGGLVTSTLLNLFVVPTLYLKIGRRMMGRARAPRQEVPDSVVA
ncbi:MAG: efflux RND transporter permease subunit [Solirubrobacteraceae bacterium]